MIKPVWPPVFLSLLGLALSPPLARSSEVKITAEFRIDPTGGANQSFVNTTPLSGFCLTWPDRCPAGQFSISTGITGVKTWRKDDDPAQGLLVGVSAEFRDLDVYKDAESHRLKFRLSAHSLRVDKINSGLAFADFSNSQFTYPLGGCNSGGVSRGSSEWIMNHWRLPTAKYYTCRSTYMRDQEKTVTYRPSFGYELIAPNPLLMHSGIYRGELRYTVGAGMDIDYGHNAQMSSDEVVLKFELDVQHQLKVDFPNGTAGRPVVATLEPDGGWQAWQGGRMPPRVRQDVPFRLSMSGPVSVHMLCGQKLGDRCAIASGDDAIPLDVAISVPGAVSDRTHAALTHIPLPIGAETAEPIAASNGSIQSVYSTIHIQSPGPFKPATTYEGQITVVFDAET